MSRKTLMFQEERQRIILDYVKENKKASVKELSNLLNTTVVTIRSDLKKLQDEGSITKTHGGVLANSYTINDVIPSDVKFQKFKDEKKKIAQIAKRFITDKDILIIDSGSTTLELAKAITQKELTVFTNDLQIALEMSKKPDVKLTVSGGALIPSVYTLAGPEGVKLFEDIHVNKLFISCDAIDKDFGISNRDKREVDLKKAMLNAADEVYLLADSSKIGQKVLIKVAGFEAFDYFITDSIEDDFKEFIEAKGIKVFTE